MKYEDAKKELKQYAKLEKKIKSLAEQEEEIRLKISSPGGQKVSGLPSAQGKINDLSSYIVAMERIRENKAIAVEKVTRINQKVSSIGDGELMEIIRTRYIKQLCWAEVGNAVDKSESWAKHNNRAAIEAYAAVSK